MADTTTSPAALFAALVREAPAPQRATLALYCETCGTRRGFVLVAETRTVETYECPYCGGQKDYKVR